MSDVVHRWDRMTMTIDGKQIDMPGLAIEAMRNAKKATAEYERTAREFFLRSSSARLYEALAGSQMSQPLNGIRCTAVRRRDELGHSIGPRWLIVSTESCRVRTCCGRRRK